MINEYSNLITRIKNEYALVVKENQTLKKQVEELNSNRTQQQYLYPKQQMNYLKAQQPKKRYLHNYIEEDDDTDIQYVVKKRRKVQPKIIYEDYVDGEDTNSNENENENEDETMEEVIEKKTAKKTVKKRCNKIYKNISLCNFCY